MIVVKVGGSLFDHPRLGPGLRTYLDSLAPVEVILVAGGGKVVDAVRELDRVHGLGEEASHWLALRAMGVMGDVLERIIDPNPLPAAERGLQTPTSLLVKGAGGLGRRRVLDSLAFAREDDSRPGALPHSWEVTSDSIAARAAVVYGAERFVLLKSVDVPPGTPWKEAAARGGVDPHFPRVVAGAAFAVEVVNFRRVLESVPA